MKLTAEHDKVMTDNKQIPKFIPELEGLRGYLAVWVLVGHWSILLPVSLEPLEQNLYNPSAVDAFICLSGFVITRLLLDSSKSYLSYIKDRFFRIFPIYICVLAASIFLLPLFIDNYSHMFEFYARDEKLAVQKDTLDNMQLYIASHLLLLHGLLPINEFPKANFAFIAPAWSLSLEWQFYLIAPFLVRALKKVEFNSIYKVISTLFIVAIIYFDSYFGVSFIGNHILLFIYGGVYAKIFSMNIKMPINISRIMLLLFSTFLIYKFHAQFLGAILWAFIMHMIYASYAYKAKFESILLQAFKSKFIIYTGKISLSIYIIHDVMLSVLMTVFKFTEYTIYTHLGVLVSAIIITFCLSSITYKYIEKPFMDFGRKLKF